MQLNEKPGRLGIVLGAVFLAEIEVFKLVGWALTRTVSPPPTAAVTSFLISSITIAMLLAAIGTFASSCFLLSRQWAWKAILWPPILSFVSLIVITFGMSDGTGHKRLFSIFACGGLLALGAACVLVGIITNITDRQRREGTVGYTG